MVGIFFLGHDCITLNLERNWQAVSVCYPDAKLLVGEIPKPLRSELRSGCAFQEMLLEKTGKTRIFMGHLLPLLPISLSVHHMEKTNPHEKYKFWKQYPQEGALIWKLFATIPKSWFRSG